MMKLNVLVLGSGGREDALCDKISKSSLLKNLYALPGNPGMRRYASLVNAHLNDFETIKNFCIEKEVDLVVVGPEEPLVKGVKDYLSNFNINVFGPSKFAAKIEGSKSFAKELMNKKGVPTAIYKTFYRDDYKKTVEFLKKSNFPVVIKVDGLAAGKGVTICNDEYQAIQTVDEIFIKNKFGNAGDKVIIEEFLEGEEVSIFVVTDGSNYVLLSPAQDYKRVGDYDRGKNTGGMGSYAFNEILSDKQIDEIKHQIIEPILDGLIESGSIYTGCLYCGLIVTRSGIKVIEFNCRFGDPETQVVLQNLDNDLLEIMYLTVKNEIKNLSVKNSGKAVCLVLASAGYPDKYDTGFEIKGLDKAEQLEDVKIYHAGTTINENKILTSGGRVLNIVSVSKKKSFRQLIQNVYEAADLIDFENKYHRKDIGLKGLNKLKEY